MEKPHNVHQFIPKGGRIEDPYVEPEIDPSMEALSKAEKELLEKRGSKSAELGIENLEQVQDQLDAQKASFERATAQLRSGDTTNIDLIKETRKVLLDFKQVAVELSNGTAEDIAVARAVSARLAELDEAMKGVDHGKSRLA